MSERRVAQDAQPERRSPASQTAGVRRATRVLTQKQRLPHFALGVSRQEEFSVDSRP